ncbi:MAG TPA: undecaprenyl-diphosphate phosphatase, partial [Vicinamibacteria bacterium]
MTALRALVLGILQGLGEFLPISSSGHLIVVPWLMGWPDSGLAFDVALHLGTLAAVAFAFWRDWARMIRAGLRGVAAGKPLADPDARLLWYVALATGFASGDSVYEVLRTYGGLAFEPGRHFRRLRASAA